MWSIEGGRRGGSISILENCTTGTKLFVIETHVWTGTEIGQYKSWTKLHKNCMKENWKSQELYFTDCLWWMNCLNWFLSHQSNAKNSINIIFCEIARHRTPCYHFGFMNNEMMSARIITLNNQVFWKVEQISNFINMFSESRRIIENTFATRWNPEWIKLWKS